MVGAFIVEGMLTNNREGIERGRANMPSNPRSQNGGLRRKYRARFKAMELPCGICGGRLGPIHYDEPSDAKHPLSFVIDEIIPISKATTRGYSTARKAAEDWGNLQPAHYLCNANKGAKTMEELHSNSEKNKKMFVASSDW